MTHTTTDAAEARALEVFKTEWSKTERHSADFGAHPWPIAIRAAFAFATAEAASGAGVRSLLESIVRPFPESCNWEDQARACQVVAAQALASLPPATDPAIPDGWKLVPVEPTDEMLEAAAKAASRNDMPSRVDDVVPYEECDSLFRAEWRAEAEAAYLAALAAAPTIPATGEAEQ